MTPPNQNKKEECHPNLPSGEWDGFYCYNHTPKQHKMITELDFADGLVSGGGVDDVSSFTWEGKYDLSSLTLTMTKTYNTHQVHYKGHIDENGIWGTWEIPFDSYTIPPHLRAIFLEAFKDNNQGGFHIWPKKNAVETNKNSDSENKESKKLKELFVEVFA